MNPCLWSFHTSCFSMWAGKWFSTAHGAFVCVCLRAVCSDSRRPFFLGAFSGLGEKGCWREEEGHAVFPCSLWGHADHSGPASHLAKSPALTWSLTHLGFSHVLTHVPTHYYFFSPSLSLGNSLMLQHSLQLSQVFSQSSHQGPHAVPASKSSFNHTAVKSSAWHS